jgi:hypothetical protein
MRRKKLLAYLAAAVMAAGLGAIALPGIAEARRHDGAG